MNFESINPATGEMMACFEDARSREIDEALTRTRQAFLEWRCCTLEERAKPMREAARYLRQHRDRLATLITEEMGKPIPEAEAEVDKCAWNFEFYAEQAPSFLADRQIATNARRSFVAFEPLGVVLAIMPWNYPIWQVFRFAAPAFMAGNGAILKHSPNVPQCALAVEEIVRESGFPDGLLRNLFISPETADKLIADPRIQAVTLTGSPRAGSEVAAAAGRAIKKSVLELGGSDPFIVLEDADLDGAVEFAVRSRFQNTGQSCIAAKRFLIVEEIADEFERRFTGAVEQLPMGDPMDRGVRVGPLAREDLRTNLDRQVKASVAMEAQVQIGGKPVDGPGYFYEPAVLTRVTPDMPVFREETFGPVAAVMRVKDAEEALRFANDSPYGLGSDLWTEDVERGTALARRIESGSVFINGMVASDPRLPFGGVKRSGFGRELSSVGIQEFTNVQTIWIGPAQGPQQSPAE